MTVNINNALVERLYQDFCEAEGGVDHPVLAAWCKCEEVFGEIDTKGKTACINNLFLETIRYVVDTLQIKEGWDEPLEYSAKAAGAPRSGEAERREDVTMEGSTALNTNRS